MKPNLEALRAEIPDYLESHGLVVYRGFSRSREDSPTVMWDTERFPQFEAFVAVAEKLGVRLMIFRDQEFYEVMVDSTLEDLEEADLPFDERRDYERRLREFRNYAGFTCAIEMTFDYEGTTYGFDLRTDWFKEFQRLTEEINSIIDEGEDNEDESPLGGYFSRN